MRPFKIALIAILLFLIPMNSVFAHTIENEKICEIGTYSPEGILFGGNGTWARTIEIAKWLLTMNNNHFAGICLADLGNGNYTPGLVIDGNTGVRTVTCTGGQRAPCPGGMALENLCAPYTFSEGTFFDCKGNKWCGAGGWANPSLCEEEDDFEEALRKSCPDCAEKRFGSIIQVEGQIMGEAVGVTGAPFNLVYNSDRAPGYKNFAWLDIPLTQATLPAALSRIDLTVSVLGKKFEYTYDTVDITSNLIQKFVWDGLDAYGREVSGSVNAHVKIVYHYATNITSTTLFGYASDPTTIGLVDPATSTTIPSRQMKQRVQEYHTPIRRVNAQSLGLGGWMMDINHLYDPNERILHTGSGNRLSDQSLNPVITTLALETGTPNFTDMAVDSKGNIYILRWDKNRVDKRDRDGNITTVVSGLNGPRGIAIAPNDDLYVADTNNHHVLKVDSSGTVTTVAGNGVADNPILDGLTMATASPLNSVMDIAVDSQGVLYLVTDLSGFIMILRVDTDGIIRHHFGGQQLGVFSTPGFIALDSEDNLYMSDYWRNRVFKITPDLKFSTVAGDGTPNVGTNAIDGVPATQSPLSPKSIAIHNGYLYIADHDDRIRRVTPGGIISTVAGPGDGSGLLKDNVPAVNSIMNPTAITVDPSGTLIIGDMANARIRQVESPLPGADSATIEIPAGGGTIINVFDATGRHTQTKSAMTNASIIDFAYDSAGRIDSVTVNTGDIDDVTTIQRDIDGNPVSITSHDGQVTLLGLDANGFLNSVTNPNGEVTTMEYDAGGLLTAFQKPKHQGTAVQSVMEYNADGLLTKDTDAAGGFVQFTRASIGQNNTEVDVTTAVGRTSAAGVTNLLGDVKSARVSTDTVGLQTTTSLGTDGSITSTGPDGTMVEVTQTPGPRFGMLAPLSKVTVTTPVNNLTSSIEQKRDPTLQTLDGDVVTSQKDEVIINGRIFTSQFDRIATGPDQFSTVSTSPEGRSSTSISDAQGRVIQSQAPGIFNSDFAYDARGRLTTVTQSDRVSSIFYNAAGFVDKVIDPENREVSFEYDAIGRIIKQILPDLREINLKYDANGNVEWIKPPGRPNHSFDYTDVDLENIYTPPDIGPEDERTFFTYNLDKQLTTVTRPDGQVISMGYDTGGRISTVTLPDSPPGTPQVYSYAYNGTTGNLDTLTGPDGRSLTFTYDGSLLLSSTWGGTSPVTGSVSRTYDNDFRITSRSVNGANTIGFVYDNDSLLTDAGAETLSYDLTNGLMTGTALGVVTDSYSYSGFGEMSNYNADANASSVFSIGYTRDKLGRIVTKTETVQGGPVKELQYDYNTAGYLITVTDITDPVNPVQLSSYSYDLNGNRENNGAVYDDQDRLLSTNTATYTYRDNGELLTKTEGVDVTQYTYGVLGNLLSVQLPDGNLVEYIIDASNRRIGKKYGAPGATVLQKAWLYKDGLNPIAEFNWDAVNSVWELAARFVYASRGNVPDYVIVPAGQTHVGTYRIISDHLGSPRLIVNTADGSVKQSIEYDEWGNETGTRANADFPNPFTFAGGLYDTDTKLIRFGARDYDPETGRWTAKDPIRFDGDGPNLYGYVLNDPVNYFDITGLAFDFLDPDPRYDPTCKWYNTASYSRVSLKIERFEITSYDWRATSQTLNKNPTFPWIKGTYIKIVLKKYEVKFGVVKRYKMTEGIKKIHLYKCLRKCGKEYTNQRTEHFDPKKELISTINGKTSEIELIKEREVIIVGFDG